MKLDLREKNGVSILVLSGKFAAGVSDAQFREAIDTLVADRRTAILVDFGDIAFMDSAGMGELVAAHRMVERFGGKLKILHPSKRIHNSLSMTKLLPIFEIFDEEETAIQSFAAEEKSQDSGS